ncbi:hypothetical protein VIBNISFn118_1890001 [Vibrio nigripulchritudo SFn118]|nr:hypothetical protein VIBNISFn118_1890001 [Vibrio nigripulchritudo SFn118]
MATSQRKRWAGNEHRTQTPEKQLGYNALLRCEAHNTEAYAYHLNH